MQLVVRIIGSQSVGRTVHTNKHYGDYKNVESYKWVLGTKFKDLYNATVQQTHIKFKHIEINDIIPRLTNFCLGKCSLSIKNTLRRLAFPIGKVHKIQLHPQFSHARKCIGPNFHFVFIQNYYPNAIRRKSVCKIFETGETNKNIQFIDVFL